MDGNYIALVVALIVWIGIFYFVMKLDNKVRKLEKKVKS
ncbi:MAG TPA: CcmD family protein [candidate division Zixibacteria bacterium]|nr:CcmD family protein [candidate division Zixibacteria bacterium]